MEGNLREVRDCFTSIDRVVDQYLAMNRLSGQKALVTNDANGIGALLAIILAMEGAEILFMHHEEPFMAFEVAYRIQESGGRLIVSEGDWNDPDNADRLTEVISQFWGHVDIVVNAVPRGSYLLMRAIRPFIAQNGIVMNVVETKQDSRQPNVVRFLDKQVVLTELTYELNEHATLRERAVQVVGVQQQADAKIDLDALGAVMLPVATRQMRPKSLFLSV